MSESTSPAGDDLADLQSELLLSTRFQMGSGAAYSADEVDDYLDQLAIGLRDGIPLTAERLADARFRIERHGYDAREVDRFFDELPSGRISAPPLRQPDERRGVGTTIGWVLLIAVLIVIVLVLI